jgi:hypothetical protein
MPSAWTSDVAVLELGVGELGNADVDVGPGRFRLVLVGMDDIFVLPAAKLHPCAQMSVLIIIEL